MFTVKNLSERNQCITFNRESAPLNIPAGGMSPPIDGGLRSFFEGLGWAEIEDIKPVSIESIGSIRLEEKPKKEEEEKPKPIKRPGPKKRGRKPGRPAKK